MTQPPLAALAAARGTGFSYFPDVRMERAGGDVDDLGTLTRVLPSAVSGREVMLLCVGGTGAMRGGANLVLNLAALGLHHMLLFAPARHVCDGIWDVLPNVACLWQPSAFSKARPASLYNDALKLFGMREFNPVALDFFQARKRLLETLVLSHRLNVLHLDADVVVLANPYPLLKGPLAGHALIFQVDGPFANAGVFYVQNVVPGDGAAWVLQELNRRIYRFTYHPESVRELPHSAWSHPPHFSNADEQANLNDVIASSLGAKQTYSAGVEFYEARFKKQFASRRCGGNVKHGKGDEECDGVRDARPSEYLTARPFDRHTTHATHTILTHYSLTHCVHSTRTVLSHYLHSTLTLPTHYLHTTYTLLTHYLHTTYTLLGQHWHTASQ